jgi:hypothetical protein
MQIGPASAEAAAVTTGAWLVVNGHPFHGLLWFSVGVYLRKTINGGRNS